MPAKLKDGTETVRVALMVPATFLEKVNNWRRRQPDMPNTSEAIRRLVEEGMESSRKKAKAA